MGLSKAAANDDVMPRHAAAPAIIWISRDEAVVTARRRRFRVSGTNARGYAVWELCTSMMEHGRPLVIGRCFDRVRDIAAAVAVIEGVVERNEQLPRAMRTG